MREAEPSSTAMMVAIRRASHQLLDDPPVFVDPLALQIIGSRARGALKANPSHFEQETYASFLRAFLAVRSRVAEDALASAIAAGTDQYVVLGAGLDTSAYRAGPRFPQLRTFEVDHPATQGWKRRLLEAAGIAIPDRLSFVPVDFERQELQQELKSAGLDPARPAFFSWLGCTMYLTDDTVWQTLGIVAAATRHGGGIVFDYNVSPLLLSAVEQAGIKERTRRLADIGEPWQSNFVPDQLVAGLTDLGFDPVEDLGPEELNPRYFADRTDELRVGRTAHIMVANVPQS